MQDYKQVIDQIVLDSPPNSRHTFGPASDTELEQLSALRLPEAVLDFYRQFAPMGWVERAIAILTVANILDEHREWGFGSFTSPHGYIPFARTLSADMYCFDLNQVGPDGEPRIVLLSHELIDPLITADPLRQIAKPIATNLREFLEQFLRDEVDERTIDGLY